jgi:hypothetical protein
MTGKHELMTDGPYRPLPHVEPPQALAWNLLNLWPARDPSAHLES